MYPNEKQTGYLAYKDIMQIIKDQTQNRCDADNWFGL